MNRDEESRGRLLDRLLVACGGSLLLYLFASHTVHAFLAAARRIVEKVLATAGAS